MKIALCQINPVAGNIAYNQNLMATEIESAARAGAQLALFTELSVTGYPPRDLLDYPGFLDRARRATEQLHDLCRRQNIAAIVGTVTPNPASGKKGLYNTAAVLLPHEDYPTLIHKTLLPTYDVFDELRYFEPAPAGQNSTVVTIALADHPPVRLGITICEDIWNDSKFWKDERLYPVDPVDAVVNDDADIIINISASPFVQNKPLRRVQMLRHVARRRDIPVVFVNQVGGNDQVVFDGGSCVVLPNGNIPALNGWFEAKTVIWDTADESHWGGADSALNDLTQNPLNVYKALRLGLRDYMARTGFTQVIVGNSGGIDSAVVLALATLALGPDDVISVTMPGHYTSSETYDDAGDLARNMGIRHISLPIGAIHEQFSQLLRTPESPFVQGILGGDATAVAPIADQNVQARIRGNILMYISNAIAAPNTLLLTTGNKSELAVGYCTLYGDMCGGLALLSDVPKMLVYQLARLINTFGDYIPQSIIDREPSAELAPDQKDSDSLPPYPVLDEIIRLFVEEHRSTEEIVAAGVADEPTVQRTVRMIELAEYKRAQAAPGIKVTSKAFGVGRRIPIARGNPIF